MNRSALPVVLVTMVAAVLVALAWTTLRDTPTASAPQAVPASQPTTAVAPVELPAVNAAEQPATENAGEATVRAPVTARTVRGQVRCKDDGAPFGAMTVALLDHQPRRHAGTNATSALATTTVSADGSFTIGPVPTKFFLHADGGDYTQSEHEEYDLGEIDEPLILQVVRSHLIEGFVHTQGGQPIGGATVTIGNESDFMRGLGFNVEDFADQVPDDAKQAFAESIAESSDDTTTQTDERGRFRVTGLQPEDGALIKIEAPGFATYRQMCALMGGARSLFVDAELEPAGLITGTVRDQSSQPLAEARVHALRSDKIIQGVLGGGMSYASVRSRADGSYALEHLPAGRYRVEARRKGWPSQVLRYLDLAGGQELHNIDFVLDPGASIAGVVVDPSGKPVEGADVHAVEPPNLADLMSTVIGSMHLGLPTKTDAQGQFTLNGLRMVKHKLSASLDGYVSATLADVMPGAAPVTLQLGAPARVSGVVMSTSTGEPVRSYQISVSVSAKQDRNDKESFSVFSMDTDEWRRDSSSQTVTDEGGRFDIGELDPGFARIDIDADDHAPAAVADVPLKSGETTKGVIIFLEPEAVVEGVVRDALTQKALPEARVRVSIPSDESKQPAGQAWHAVIPTAAQDLSCDDAGHFRAGKMPRGTAEITASLDHYRQAEPLRVATAPGRVERDLVIELQPETVVPKGAVEGTVYTAAGKPRKGAMLFVTNKLSLSDLDGDPVITDGRGYFRVDEVPAGRTNVVLLKGDSDLNLMSLVSMLSKRQVVPVEIKANETINVTIRESGEGARGCRVHGTVSSGGAPLPHTMIVAMRENGGAMKMATTDEQGRYEMTEVEAGRWRFGVTQSEGAESGSGVPVDVPDAQDARRDLIVPDGKVTGVVIDASSKKPIEGIAVFATPDDIAPTSFLASMMGHSDSVVRTDARGAFALPHLAPGSYTIRAGGAGSSGAARDYAQAARPAVVIRASEAATADFALQPGRVVAGVVNDQAGRGIGAVALTLHDVSGTVVDGSEGVTTDTEGHYRYSGLSAGRFYLIAAWQDQVTQASAMFDVGDQSEARVDFVLQKGVPVTVTVSNLPSTFDFGDVEVDATDAKGCVYRRMVSDAMIESFLLGGFTPGEYRLGPFPPGTYSLTVRKGAAVLFTRSVTLKNPEGETFEIDGTTIK